MSTPLQNRVDPWGVIAAVAARGTMMGNRGGRLHRPDRTLGRARWRSHRWIICEITFRGRRRTVMGTGYTELFFLDEVTALAAGHRPCFECRRSDAVKFASLWPGPGRQRADDIDSHLHVERLSGPRFADISALPDGAVIERDGAAFAICGSRLWRWSWSGYVDAGDLPAGRATVLTPPATLSVLAAGYAPRWYQDDGGRA